MKHTPGPWWNSGLEVGTVPMMDIKIAHVSGFNYDQAKANAKLIAQAPDLLRALEGMKWFVDHIMGDQKRVDWGNTFDMDWGKINEVFLDMENTLKKAKGES